MKELELDTNQDMELLRRMFQYGGYTTTFSVKAYLKNYTFRAIQYILKRLTDKGWLEQIPFYSSSRRFPIVYKVTGKSCNYFDENDSYLKRRHTDIFIIRSLMRQHFVFEILGKFERNIVSDSEGKISLLSVDREEYLLDFIAESESRTVSSRNGEVIFSSSPEKVVVVYIDKSTKNPYSQVQSLIRRYERIGLKTNCKLDFLIITDLKRREYSYQKLIENYKADLQRNKFGIPAEVIRLHKKFLVEKLGINPIAVEGFEEKVREKFIDKTCFELSDKDKVMMNAVQENGIKAIGKMAMDILNTEADLEKKKILIKELFQKVYRFYSCGYFSGKLELGITVYRIGYTYSVTV